MKKQMFDIEMAIVGAGLKSINSSKLGIKTVISVENYVSCR